MSEIPDLWIFEVLFVGIVIVLLVRRFRYENEREKWEADQCCPECGYDLRASKGRCPECGKPFLRQEDRTPYHPKPMYDGQIVPIVSAVSEGGPVRIFQTLSRLSADFFRQTLAANDIDAIIEGEDLIYNSRHGAPLYIVVASPNAERAQQILVEFVQAEQNRIKTELEQATKQTN
jgi:hypothetical protein